MNPGLRLSITSSAPQSPSYHPPVPHSPPTLPPPSSMTTPRYSVTKPVHAPPPPATVESQIPPHTHSPAPPARRYTQPAPHPAAPSTNSLHRCIPHKPPTQCLPYRAAPHCSGSTKTMANALHLS